MAQRCSTSRESRVQVLWCGEGFSPCALTAPWVRELFDKDPLPSPKTTWAEMKDIDADYYGYRDRRPCGKHFNGWCSTNGQLDTLPQKQNLFKGDRESYNNEFLHQFRIFSCVLENFRLEPDKNAPTRMETAKKGPDALACQKTARLKASSAGREANSTKTPKSGPLGSPSTRTKPTAHRRTRKTNKHTALETKESVFLHRWNLLRFRALIQRQLFQDAVTWTRSVGGRLDVCGVWSLDHREASRS
ncbi:hypothetical protein pipiens_015471 [Culex pipiens pipiens]|uniref:Uncharacterized protein n=1 Tax=Culex pipiens pipiens TaxID=38569 RepID=A0ABD1CQD0_CULPP